MRIAGAPTTGKPSKRADHKAGGRKKGGDGPKSKLPVRTVDLGARQQEIELLLDMKDALVLPHIPDNCKVVADK